MEVEVESRIHELDKVVESKELGTHARLVAKEVSLLERGCLAMGESQAPTSRGLPFGS